MLGTEIAPTYEEMNRAIYREVAGETWVQRLDKYLDRLAEGSEDTESGTGTGGSGGTAGSTGTTGAAPPPYSPIGDIMRIADTDSHRVYNESGFNTAKLGGAKTKTWICHFHNSRDWHIYLHKTTIPIDSEFYTYLGNHALYPGQFGVAEEDCNCICTLEFSK